MHGAPTASSSCVRPYFLIVVALFLLEHSMTPRKRNGTLSVVLWMLVGLARADGMQKIDPINVFGHYETAVGTTDAASAGYITPQLIDDRPLLRPGEVLEYVPRMIVTQHSGAGKANQYFLRGFNLDHGTDFATTWPACRSTSAHTRTARDTWISTS